MRRESFALIKNKFESGIYSLKDMFDFVSKGWLTKRQFQWITSYNYDGLQKSRGW